MAEVQSNRLSNGSSVMGHRLSGVGRCPYCSVANPSLVRQWASEGPLTNSDGVKMAYWGSYKCENCASIVTVSSPGVASGVFYLNFIIPTPKSAHEDLPEMARVYLQQAYDTLHAPDASAVMAGSSVDAMLKAIGYTKGSLYERIDKALEDNVLTKGMAEWAHEVRLGSNRPRHADQDKPHVSRAEAAQSVEFAEALGNFLFVLTARVDRGIKAAAAAAG